MNRQFWFSVNVSVRIPQTGWFKLTKIYYLAILDTGSLKSNCPQGKSVLMTLGRICSTPFVSFCDGDVPWHLLVYRLITPISASLITWFSPVCLCLFFCCKDTIIFGFNDLILVWLQLLKHYFQNKVTFMVLSIKIWMYLSGNTIQQ